MSEEHKDKTTKEIQIEITNLCRAKFKEPYFDELTRKQVDSLIFELWKELKSRE
jgi:hypothetical protein